MFRESTSSYAFGPFLLSPVNRLLLRAGRRVPLTPKTFDTLLLLVEGRGDVLSKEQLMSALWPDSFVEEANLAQNIAGLRKALGGDAERLAQYGDVLCEIRFFDKA